MCNLVLLTDHSAACSTCLPSLAIQYRTVHACKQWRSINWPTFTFDSHELRDRLSAAHLVSKQPPLRPEECPAIATQSCAFTHKLTTLGSRFNLSLPSSSATSRTGISFGEACSAHSSCRLVSAISCGAPYAQCQSDPSYSLRSLASEGSCCSS